MFSVVRVQLAGAKPGPSHTASHTSTHSQPGPVFREPPHGLWLVSVTGSTVGRLISCFTISVLNPIFYCVPK